jgi:phage tail P2-like protein
MNKELKTTDFYETFPPALKRDENMAALGRLIAEELHITANEAEKNIIYANIDTLSERWLDTLAYDLHVDWYDYDYPVEAKRAIIKDSVRVHQKLGTKAAVERALGGIHPLSEIEEWFDYNGEPYHFRIVLDTTKSRVSADYDEIVRTVNIYKRLTAHLDGLYYQCHMSIVVTPSTDYFIYTVPMTGQLKAGTYPHRNVEGVVIDPVIIIQPTAAGYGMEAVRTGTKPDRNIVFTAKDSEVVTDSDTKGYKFNSTMTGKEFTGTKPYRDTVGGAEIEELTAQAAGTAYKFESDFTGTNPERNVLFDSEDVAAVEETETEAYLFDSEITGNKPNRNIEFREKTGAVVTESETEETDYTANMTGQTTTGTEPEISTQAGVQSGEVTQLADTESYQYEVKRCGASGLCK